MHRTSLCERGVQLGIRGACTSHELGTLPPFILFTSSIIANSSSPCVMHRRHISEDLFEGPLDLKAGERHARKGPPVAHSLPVYKTTHKLHQSARWKKANLISNVVGGKDYRLRETQGEGGFDESGMYRDWLYGDERRYANYIAILLGSVAIGLFFYTLRAMGTETWDIPAPVLASQRRKLARTQSTSTGESSPSHNDGNNSSDATGKHEEEVKTTSELGKVGTRAQNEDALAMLKRPAVLSRAAETSESHKEEEYETFLVN